MKAQVNSNQSFDLKSVDWDIVEIKDRVFHILYNNQSYVADVVNANFKTKSFKIVINHSTYDVVLKDRFDELLHKLGMDQMLTNAENDVKAPMPGRIINVEAKTGDTVNQGDKLLILEAMKMENIIKSSRSGIIKSIEVTAGQTVEKNQVMFVFE
jgi:biotin carboxyl carrier protein